MKILIACEESQRVCLEFRNLGHEAYSCDIEDCSGGHPEWHIKQDVLPLLNGNCSFCTLDQVKHQINGKWDLIIAFPPCTHLAVSGAMWFEEKRKDGRQRAGLEFFCRFLDADCQKICVENPMGIVSGDYVKQWFPDIADKYKLPKKPTQIIQPWHFGDNAVKTTCLWLKGLMPLDPWVIKKPKMEYVYWFDNKDKRMKRQPKWYADARGSKDRSKIRSKTFPGVAKAMAEQWGRKGYDLFSLIEAKGEDK